MTSSPFLKRFMDLMSTAPDAVHQRLSFLEAALAHLALAEGPFSEEEQVQQRSLHALVQQERLAMAEEELRKPSFPPASVVAAEFEVMLTPESLGGVTFLTEPKDVLALLVPEEEPNFRRLPSPPQQRKQPRQVVRKLPMPVLPPQLRQQCQEQVSSLRPPLNQAHQHRPPKQEHQRHQKLYQAPPAPVYTPVLPSSVMLAEAFPPQSAPPQRYLPPSASRPPSVSIQAPSRPPSTLTHPPVHTSVAPCQEEQQQWQQQQQQQPPAYTKHFNTAGELRDKNKKRPYGAGGGGGVGDGQGPHRPPPSPPANYHHQQQQQFQQYQQHQYQHHQPFLFSNHMAPGRNGVSNEQAGNQGWGGHQQPQRPPQYQQQYPRQSGWEGGGENTHHGPPPPSAPPATSRVMKKFVPPVKGGGEGGGGGAGGGKGIRGMVDRAFKGPGQQQNGGRGGGGGGKGDDELPEELKGCDPVMVERIELEIIDRGQPVTFDDIAGLEFAKKTIIELIVWPMKNPQLFQGLRALPRGLLLFGPPGTGKTLIAKAIAHQSGATFFNISASSLTSKWIGEGEKLVRVLFKLAAYHSPAIIFIDEVDSLLCQRSADENEASRRLKTEFLVQLDGCGSAAAAARVLLVGATNRPQELDEAARRRFVKRLYIDLPEALARRNLIELLLRKNSHNLTRGQIEQVVAQSKGFSGSDVHQLCTEAAMGPIRDMTARTGGDISAIDLSDVPPISFLHFQEALSSVRPSVSEKDLGTLLDWNDEFGTYARGICGAGQAQEMQGVAVQQQEGE